MSLFRTTVCAGLATALLVVLAAVPASAQPFGREHTIRFRAGLFEPDGESQYWTDAAEVFTSDAEDFEDTLLGFDYKMGLSEHLGLLLSVSGYEGQETRNYLDFVDFQNREIRHDATLDVTSLTAGLVFDFAPNAVVNPYVGVGGGLYSWELTESGRFIDFASPGLDIFRATFRDEGEAFGWYGQAGLEVPLSASWSLFAEGRWHDADDELSGEFEGFGDLDLSGRELSAGATWTF